MNTRQLETFLLASETLNLTETAKKLNFAQSSITSHIKKLEEELGYDLFERFGRRVVLTNQGLLFKKKAIQLLTLMNEAKEIGNTNISMIIGAQESQCIYRIPKILSNYQKLFPNIKISFRPAHSNYHVLKEILNGNIDIGFITDFQVDSSKLIIHKLIDEKILLLCSPLSDFSKRKQITLSDMKNETYLFTEKDCSYRVMFENLLEKEGIYPSNIIEFTSIEAIKQCVKLNTGITVLPELTVREEIKNNELISMNVGEEFPLASTYIVYHKDKQLSQSLEAFIKLSREFFLSQ